MLEEGQRYGPQGLAPELYYDYLDSHCEEDYHEEERVVEEASEHVQFVLADFARINFVEDLHEDKGVKHQGVMCN